jgi:riboflavin synthase
MFTGLIETVGTVDALRRSGGGARLKISARWPDREIPEKGDSIAVNGACLTAVEPSATGFAADLSPETLQRTSLGELGSGLAVNLERALKLGDRLGGHIVQGHVDATVQLTRRDWDDLITKRTSIGKLLLDGAVDLDGSRLALVGFFAGLDEFERNFPIVTP